MCTHDARFGAVLFADFAIQFAGSGMTDLDAFMLSTFQWFVTGHAATEVLLAAWDYLTLFVLSMAVFGSEGHARRACGRGVTIMRDRMVAVMRA